MFQVRFFTPSFLSQAKEDWLRDAVLHFSRFMASPSANDSSQFPVEVSVRVSHSFDHELQALLPLVRRGCCSIVDNMYKIVEDPTVQNVEFQFSHVVSTSNWRLLHELVVWSLSICARLLKT